MLRYVIVTCDEKMPGNKRGSCPGNYVSALRGGPPYFTQCGAHAIGNVRDPCKTRPDKNAKARQNMQHVRPLCIPDDGRDGALLESQ
jgi:hypothetical protein